MTMQILIKVNRSGQDYYTFYTDHGLVWQTSAEVDLLAKLEELLTIYSQEELAPVVRLPMSVTAGTVALDECPPLIISPAQPSGMTTPEIWYEVLNRQEFEGKVT